MGFLAGKRLLITGVLSNRSIAYGVARACHREGAELAFSYVGERFRDRVSPASPPSSARRWCSTATSATTRRSSACSASSARPGRSSTASCTRSASRRKEAIAGDFLEGLSRESFRIAHDISSYSFPALAKALLPLLQASCERRAALLTLTYLGLRACRTTTRWEWRRPRWRPACATWRNAGRQRHGVNGLCDGPIKTLAASGIADFGKMLEVTRQITSWVAT